jgi:hypothetical protein
MEGRTPIASLNEFNVKVAEEKSTEPKSCAPQVQIYPSKEKCPANL